MRNAKIHAESVDPEHSVLLNERTFEHEKVGKLIAQRSAGCKALHLESKRVPLER